MDCDLEAVHLPQEFDRGREILSKRGQGGSRVLILELARFLRKQKNQIQVMID